MKGGNVELITETTPAGGFRLGEVLTPTRGVSYSKQEEISVYLPLGRRLYSASGGRKETSVGPLPHAQLSLSEFSSPANGKPPLDPQRPLTAPFPHESEFLPCSPSACGLPQWCLHAY